jgi:hypothetical protein
MLLLLLMVSALSNLLVLFILDAFENARFLCDRYYMCAPEVVVEAVNSHSPKAPITIEFVPSHLYHIMFELFKVCYRYSVLNLYFILECNARSC